MPKKSAKKWWHEPKSQIKGKDMIRRICRKYGAGCVEEEVLAVDLHEFEPELYPKRHVRSYQADLLVTQSRGKILHIVAVELDGGYHQDRKQEDALRDERIFKKYGIPTVRFDTDKLLKGEYSESEIAEKLGLV